MYKSDRIQNIYIKSLYDTTSAFSELTQLKHVKFDKQPYIYGENTFYMCRKLQETGLFREGLLDIKKRAFEYCIAIKEINLPKSVRTVNISAFRNCININTLRINGNVLFYKENGIFSNDKGVKLLDSDRAVVYCPYDYPINTLRECIGDNVKIVRNKPTKYDKCSKLQEKVNKANLIGIRVPTYQIASTEEDVMTVIKFMEPISFREQLLECMNESLQNNELLNRTVLIGKYGLFVKVRTKFVLHDVSKLRKASVGKNFMVVITNKQVSVYAISLEMITKYLIKKGKEHYAIRGDGTIVIPHYEYSINSKRGVPDNMYEEGDKVVLVFGDKTIKIGVDKLGIAMKVRV